jgi:hypothetical protein
VPGAPWAAGTAIKARAPWTSAAIGASATAVWTASAAAITSTTLRALESRARVAADASGVAREIFARSGRAGDARSAGFAREQDDVVFDDRGSSGCLASVSFDEFRFGVFVRGSVLYVFAVLFFVVFVQPMFRLVVHDVLRIAEGSCVFGGFVCGVGFEFGAIGGAMLFDFLGFILGEFRLCGDLVFRCVEPCFFFGFFFR